MCEELFFDKENNLNKSFLQMFDADIVAVNMYHS